ncbi:MAG: UbiA family prenyltransferase [Verrucomicrobiae bacterium]|nr:UbiA family prenyltransferase [Verrucomicrobiae bacterium]
MSSEFPSKPPIWKTLLDLGRVSNLPTVWSNCLAGWLIGGGGSVNQLALLCLGASMIYVGGMYLNDAFDVTWDVDHKSDRPIPSGFIAERPVWILGWLWMGLGFWGVAYLGGKPAILGAQLVLCVLAYDAFHKKISWSPILMAGCRFYLLLTAAACGAKGVNGYAVWVALVLALYVVGLSYLARAECLPGLLRHWPLILLAAPVALAVLVNDGGAREKGLVAALILILWTAKSLRHLLWTKTPSVGRTVCGLLAGICLVDLLAVAYVQPAEAAVFLGLFLFSLGLQRVIAAT